MKKGIPVTARWFPAVLLAVTAGMTGQSALAMEVHTWTDQNGVANFSDIRPAITDFKTIEIGDTTQSGNPPANTQPPESRLEESEEPVLTAAQKIRQDIAARRMARHEERERTDPICGQHRNRLMQMLPARRVYYPDENGQEVRMDDTERVALIEESQNYLAENCN